MIEFRDETRIAINAARKAGEKILSIYNSGFETEWKKDGSVITIADRESDNIIKEFLGKIGLPILSEEAEDNSVRLGFEKIWIVDPLDGTYDFVDRTGEFSVMIALVEKQAPIIGVVYQPVIDVLFVAEKGRGAYMRKDNEWTPLVVGQIKNLGEARAVMSRHHITEPEKNFLELLSIKDSIQMGSAGLKAVAIAQGQADLYFTMTSKIKQWDTAAAYVIVSEAGGKITDMLGNKLVYNTEDVHHQNGILISNKYLHEQILDAYRK